MNPVMEIKGDVNHEKLSIKLRAQFRAMTEETDIDPYVLGDLMNIVDLRVEEINMTINTPIAQSISEATSSEKTVPRRQVLQMLGDIVKGETRGILTVPGVLEEEKKEAERRKEIGKWLNPRIRPKLRAVFAEESNKYSPAQWEKLQEAIDLVLPPQQTW
jgi:hypothetical protein